MLLFNKCDSDRQSPEPVFWQGCGYILLKTVAHRKLGGEPGRQPEHSRLISPSEWRPQGENGYPKGPPQQCKHSCRAVLWGFPSRCGKYARVFLGGEGVRESGVEWGKFCHIDGENLCCLIFQFKNVQSMRFLKFLGVFNKFKIYKI